MIEITRKASFCAGHRLHNPALPDEDNREMYGCCNNPHGHGHNYTLEVTLRGEPDSRSGMVMDLNKLNEVIEEEIVAKVDHRNLNLDVDFLRDVIPTAENLAVCFWRVLEARLPEGLLHEVRLYESEENYVTYRGE